MILRLFHLIKNWTLLFVFGFSFTSCKQCYMEDVCFLRDRLVMPLMDISSCITGVEREVDHHGNIIRKRSCEINFSKAYALFPDVARRLREYPKIIKYSIAQSILKEINQILSELKQDIESLSDGLEKNQFRREWNQLAQYVSSLIV